MLKKVLSLSGVQELNSSTQKEISGGGNFGDYLDGVNTTTEPDGPYSEPTPTWKYRCFSLNHTTGGTYFMSNTMLKGYKCELA
ncbi:hypothetical protein [uncultured Tenacibaculum sp.]|uniref:hypothetical protein n=1 Tax=uncultured Tenacibaculum sp. TaxID=174713 RepID=UPI002638D768|nr:hypothetical protein [uncultured Tenacibaculum sp.]